MNLYCVYDVETETYNPPFVESKDAVAIRSFAQALKGHSPAGINFRLVRVGTFDFNSGQVEGDIPTIITSGISGE